MTNTEFATRLLFWLLPWPISKVLPRSLRIYYWGPTGIPPVGFYDYWGIPKWLDPALPPYDQFIENPPEDPPPWWLPSFPDYDQFIDNPPEDPPPWWPINPYNPPPPDQWPAPPPGPVNPSNPYTPGPGPVNPHPPIPSGVWTSCFDNTYWERRGADPGISWNAAGNYWDATDICRLYPIGTWAAGFRPTKFRMTFTDAPGDEIPDLYLKDANVPPIHNIFFEYNYTSGTELDCIYDGYDIARLTLNQCHVTNIEFYS